MKGNQQSEKQLMATMRKKGLFGHKCGWNVAA